MRWPDGLRHRAASSNNLKQIGLALMNYHCGHNRFPARAIFDKQGKPLLSWRVQMLPYFGPGRPLQAVPSWTSLGTASTTGKLIPADAQVLSAAPPARRKPA